MSEKPLLLKIISIVIYLTAFISVCLFVNTQMNKYDYFIYLYGTSTAPGSKALVKVLSRDGELVSNPAVFVNGVKQPSSLIDLRPDMKEIKVVFGTTEAVFPLKYKDVADYSFKPQKKLRPTKQEAEKAKIVNVGNRKIFLLPENFRAVPEFETTVGLYCTENDKPCTETSIFLDGSQHELNGGFMKFTTVFGKDQGVNVSFENGDSAYIPIPYPGKMFKFYKTKDSLTLASLSDIRNVHIDCFNDGKWVGTDIVSVSYEGLVLPKVYTQCDTVQASLNSAYPGTMFAVLTNVKTPVGKVDDPYYSALSKAFQHFSSSAQKYFTASYNSSFYQPLSTIFSGEKLEKEFNAARDKELSAYRIMLIISSILGFALFAYIMFKNIKVVEDEDGEVISNSLAKQRAIAICALAFFALFILGLLYFLNNLA
ncbi:hypothetical protein IKO70_10035 [bacterium]|jgi:hypothetical protein|nr:hypothetical protein [bacterium]